MNRAEPDCADLKERSISVRFAVAAWSLEISAPVASAMRGRCRGCVWSCYSSSSTGAVSQYRASAPQMHRITDATPISGVRHKSDSCYTPTPTVCTASSPNSPSHHPVTSIAAPDRKHQTSPPRSRPRPRLRIRLRLRHQCPPDSPKPPSRQSPPTSSPVSGHPRQLPRVGHSCSPGPGAGRRLGGQGEQSVKLGGRCG